MTYEEFRKARKHLTKSDYYAYSELESASHSVGFACDSLLTFLTGHDNTKYGGAVLEIIHALRECEAKIEKFQDKYRDDHPVLWPPREWEDREMAEFCDSLREGPIGPGEN